MLLDSRDDGHKIILYAISVESRDEWSTIVSIHDQFWGTVPGLYWLSTTFITLTRGFQNPQASMHSQGLCWPWWCTDDVDVFFQRGSRCRQSQSSPQGRKLWRNPLQRLPPRNQNQNPLRKPQKHQRNSFDTGGSGKTLAAFHSGLEIKWRGCWNQAIDFCLKTGGSREAVTWHFSTLVGMLLQLCLCALHHLQSWIDRACVLYWWHSSVMLLNTGSWKQIKFCMQVQDGPNFCFSCIFVWYLSVIRGWERIAVSRLWYPVSAMHSLDTNFWLVVVDYFPH